jgi:hypothetical protein
LGAGGIVDQYSMLSPLYIRVLCNFCCPSCLVTGLSGFARFIGIKVHFYNTYTVIRPFSAVMTAVRTVRVSKIYLRLRLRHPRNRRPTVCVRPIPVTVRRAALRLTTGQLEQSIWNIHFPFRRLPVWHKIKFTQHDPATNLTSTADSIHARPAKVDSRGRPVPGRFDTALVNDGTGGDTGIEGVCLSEY